MLPLLGSNAAVAQWSVPLIFDTDMGNDVDDALALGMIHTLQSQVRCKLLAVTLTKDEPFAAPFVDVVNTFFGRGEVPIGVVRGGVTPEPSKFTGPLATAEDGGKLRFPHKLRDGRAAPEATGLLRKVLAGQRDGSVVIVQVGFSTNMARLLDSSPDASSPLDGEALVKKKVRLLSVMGGRFGAPAGDQRFKEYNIKKDVGSARKVFTRWPTPIVASGFEIGNAIHFPAKSIEQDYGWVPHHPLAEAYRLYMPMPYDRPTWDLTSVLYAFRPTAGYFDLSPPGRVIVEDDGFTRFQPAEGGPHRYLILRPEQTPRIREHFVALCRQAPDRFLTEPPAWKLLAQKPNSTRTRPEKRVELGNRSLRLDFDPRTSDTCYNYIWIRRPDTGSWERVHNFGIDVHAPKAGDGEEINCVGMNLALRREGDTMHVGYPRPIIQYRQFDETVGRADRIRRYPDFTAKELPALVHADAALEFRYQLDPQRPSFTVYGRVVEGRVLFAICIINALWTDNHVLPTHEYLAGGEEYDVTQPESVRCKDLRFERVPQYAIFYRHDGQGVPFAFVPLEGAGLGICNFYDNWQCLRDFWKSTLNQQFIPDDPALKGCNDAGFIAAPRADGSLPGVRVVFFPELGWRQAGTGHELRKKIEDSLRRSYLVR